MKTPKPSCKSQISDENGTADPRRALQLPADVIAAGLTPNPRK